MKVGDLVRVKNTKNYLVECGQGYLLEITAKASNEGYFIIVMSGPHLGKEHWVHGEDLEVISESR